MSEPISKRILCLSNVHDQNYEAFRDEEVEPSLSAPKRRALFQCLERASGREVVLLSSPPRARARRRARWLPRVETRFSTHRQYVCANWDAPKVRVPLSWAFYAVQALRRARPGDVAILDNYEFIYVVAAWLLRMGRGIPVLLDYEDGKHLIPSKPWGLLNATAERVGRPLVRAALLAHPGLGRRLPRDVPTLLVPGFVTPQAEGHRLPPDQGIHFLYSGSLDRVRGVDLLLATLPLLPEHGWHLHVSGRGDLESEVARVAEDARWASRVTFHGTLANQAYAALIQRCHVGLNCQRASDPVSSVTFPSKIFSYLSAGLVVLSSRASEVPAICGDACEYFDEETPAALAKALQRVQAEYRTLKDRLPSREVFQKHTIEGTVQRMRDWLSAAQVV